MYGVNLRTCYWTVARDETLNPARRGHRLDNGWHHDVPAEKLSGCSHGGMACSSTGPGSGSFRVLSLVLVTNLSACGPKTPPAYALLVAGPLVGPVDRGVRRRAAEADVHPARRTVPGRQSRRHVNFDFAGSSELATQLTSGATADIFASTDSAQMDTVAKAGLTETDPVNFASNTLVIVTPPGDPKQIHSFADLAKPGLNVVVCGEPAPCGAATQRIEDNTGVHLNPVSEEPAVSDVLTKVTSGEADAGLVYVTDARNAGNKVTTVKFAESADAANVIRSPSSNMRRSPRWRRSSSTW